MKINVLALVVCILAGTGPGFAADASLETSPVVSPVYR